MFLLRALCRLWRLPASTTNKLCNLGQMTWILYAWSLINQTLTASLLGLLGDDIHKTLGLVNRKNSVSVTYHFSYCMFPSCLRLMPKNVSVNIIRITISIFAGTFIITSLLAIKSFHPSQQLVLRERSRM